MNSLILPGVSGWYGPTEPGWTTWVMDGARPRRLDTKPLLVGLSLREARSERFGALSGEIARKLSLILGITYETFLCLFERVNLLSKWPEDFVPRRATLKLLAAQLGDRPPGVPVVYLGRRTADAFGHYNREYEWNRDGDVPAVALRNPDRIAPLSSELDAITPIADALRDALLYHGRLFRVGDYPNGRGSMVMIQKGSVWGDAARRLKHRSRESS